LTAKFGPNGFDVTYPLDDSDDAIEYEDEPDEPPA
jgi:hypothetical protein